MRAALHGLTIRGRCLLAAGIAVTGASVLLAQRDLLRVGVLLVSLPLACVWVVVRTRYRLACVRRLDRSRIAAGEEATVSLRLENISRLPSGVLLVEDTVPYVLGSRPRFVLDRVEPRGAREVAYAVRSDVRGRFQLGPLAIRLTDPFGMCELTRAFASRDTLVVTPVVHALPPVRLAGEWAGSGESRARSVAAAGEDDAATREYRDGDDLRRVHWRSTARLGALMVRREEQPWQSRCTLLLDTRAAAHRGDGPGSSFEWAVSAAASVGVHLVRHGYHVRLLSSTGASVSSAAHAADGVGGDFEGALLDALAVVGPSTERSLHAAIATLRRGGGDGLLVAVLGALSIEDAGVLARLRHGATVAVAVLLDTPTWVSATTEGQRRAASDDTSGRVLRSAGWRVLPAGVGDRLADVWPEAGQRKTPAAAWAGGR